VSKSDEKTKHEGVRRPAMAQQQRPLSITGEGYHIIYRVSTIIYRVLVSKLVRGGEKENPKTHPHKTRGTQLHLIG
jgi:hypothetical protein